MSDVLVIAATGLVAGALHVLSGPDHLAAIAPLAVDSRRSVWRAGFLWGVGHTSGVLLVGALTLLLRELLPIERFSSFSERAVGAALIVVGIWGFRRALRMRVHLHAHQHDGTRHAHVHVHDARHEHAPAVDAQPAHDHMHASFSFGILHGFAGSSHVFGILPALAFATRSQATAYLASYGIGTVAAMTGFSALVGVMATRARFRGTAFYRNLLYGCSTAAVIVGGFWLLT